MLKATLVLYVMNRCLSKVCYDHSERDTQLPGKIVATDEIKFEGVSLSGELTLKQKVSVYRTRGIKETAFLILVDAAAAWKLAGNEVWSVYCLEAARRLSYIFYNEPDLDEIVLKTFRKNMEERTIELARAREFFPDPY